MEAIIKKYINENKEGIVQLIKQLCEIPAPSHFEHERAQFCKKWLESNGATGVTIDEAQNVVFPLHCENSNQITVFAAHTDTVFPDTEPMPYFDDGEKIYSPGVADDTASVSILLYMAKFFLSEKRLPPNGILFVFNSCEEGLGNLKGTRQIFKDYEGRIANFISFDDNLNVVADRCVGSHRYEVEVITEGGHSYDAFGQENAIAKLSEMIAKLYQIQVPVSPGTKTTYNVGTVLGGTSVNTIAQSAKMLCEYRSDDKDCLAMMRHEFQMIFESFASQTVQVHVKKVGDRPCSNIESHKVEALKKIVVPMMEKVLGQTISFRSSSTDCNIPLSLGIPALCIGVNLHHGIHTREEWVEKGSLSLGLELAIKLGIKVTEV
ncbi:MAG: M20/M25/M40 family metallo-hydrolase [Ruminococcaceae bacterium]|nr:M20/M25/M40 family metallo-hydrolase [Oscillospiraceae bacterium]